MNLILKYMKKLLIYLQNSKTYFPATLVNSGIFRYLATVEILTIKDSSTVPGRTQCDNKTATTAIIIPYFPKQVLFVKTKEIIGKSLCCLY